MSKLFLRLILVVGTGLTAAACQDPGYGANGAYQPAAAYGTPYYNSGYAPAPVQYGYAQPAYGYAQPAYGYAQPAPAYNQARYATVTVTNRGQNGNRDDVVQQQVACGSQYFDGYRTRTAPRC